MPSGQPRSSGDQVVADNPVKRRPKNRKSTIASVAAEQFGALGYHAVSMEDIAAKVDVSAAALYRHYPSKYALFREAVLALGAKLRESAVLPDEATDWSPEARIDWLLQSIATMTINNRQSGALYRWEGRYLHSADQRLLFEQASVIHFALAECLAELRPALDPTDRAMLVAANLAILGSITDHHATLPPKAIQQLLGETCWTVLRCDLPSATGEPARTEPATEIPDTFKHELLLEQAILLFHERGYHEVGIDDIAAAAGLPPSGVYRYYRSKADLLAAAFRRAADRVSAAIPVAVAQSPNSREALTRLVEKYVAGAFAEKELTFVYYAEIGNVPPHERSMLRNIQRLNVEEWARLLTESRPELSSRQARFLVHAALGLVVDLGRMLHFDKSPASEGRVQYLMLRVLFGAEE
ncbi:TetR/AcrR family transcriptional regulator [Aldersonia sp. NBC_00410]|uniref:TetR/AcrR family transcriptional regulator n=1 Tax=Aldersonia sp. NBC_00410 TaxID=2975954 RepID=UPI00224D2831|nr:TetR/AcrR family transcriptional regulator [Aldersonia sp. NBC_00410]MCX5045648.1 TetR/AcrR family transcriptional regulator [Aldersonia sp. NBC_00410]